MSKKRQARTSGSHQQGRRGSIGDRHMAKCTACKGLGYKIDVSGVADVRYTCQVCFGAGTVAR